jgi:histidine ammonia-lyase
MGEQLMTITLNGSDLTVTQVVAVARHGETVALAPAALEAMQQARAIVEKAPQTRQPVYGLTTGVAERKSFLLDPADRQRFNRRLGLNHLAAQGDAAPADVVRGAMVCLANSYAKGVTGVRPELAGMIVTLLNEGFAPPVRRLGSVGEGDLGPMADLADGLITRSGFEVAENEGLALVSSNAFTTAWACLALADAQMLMDTFDVAGALDLEAFGANLTCLHPVIEQTRPFPGLAATLATLRTLLNGSYLWQPGAARFLQDPLTFAAARRGARGRDVAGPDHRRAGPAAQPVVHPAYLDQRARAAGQPARGGRRRRWPLRRVPLPPARLDRRTPRLLPGRTHPHRRRRLPDRPRRPGLGAEINHPAVARYARTD